MEIEISSCNGEPGDWAKNALKKDLAMSHSDWSEPSAKCVCPMKREIEKIRSSRRQQMITTCVLLGKQSKEI